MVVAAVAPRELADFWARALRWNTRSVGGRAVALVPTDDVTTFRVLFAPGAHRHEKVGQNRIHFDLTTTSPTDQADSVYELEALGARRVDIGQGSDEPHVVLADPEGNELCVIGPDNRFLASSPRLGAVNCDGTRALGRFYSDALGWPLVWDQDEETAIQAPDGTGPRVTWSGPPLMPRPVKERFHVHVAPARGVDARSALDHLLVLGATRRQRGTPCNDAIGLTDVDGNELCFTRSSADAPP